MKTDTGNREDETRPGRAPAHASADTIESTLASNREALDHTLTLIQQRISMESLMQNTMERLRSESGKEFLRGLRETAVRNPVPITMIALGVAWTALADRTGSPARGRLSFHGGTRARPQAEAEVEVTTGQRSRPSTGRVGQRFGSARERASRVGGGAATRSREAARNSWAFTREHPVFVAGAGLAFGAALAALVPLTRTERETIGPTRDEAVRGGARVATEAGRGAVSGMREEEATTTAGERAEQRP